MDEMLFKDVLDSTSDVVVITESHPLEEPDGPKIVFVNSAFYELTGYGPDEVIGKTPRILQGPKTNRDTLNQIKNAIINEEKISVELLNYSKSGEEYWLDFTITPIYNDKGKLRYFAAIERDITDKKAQEEILKTSAFEDHLTGVYNRRYFQQESKTALARLERHGELFALMIFDLDDFKGINDNFGHAQGDKALRHVAEICKLIFRDTDFIFRYGGDEFVILLQGAKNHEEILKKGQLLIDTIKSISNGSISISIGATLATKDDEVIQVVFDRADKALYDVKKSGKGQIKVLN